MRKGQQLQYLISITCISPEIWKIIQVWNSLRRKENFNFKHQKLIFLLKLEAITLWNQFFARSYFITFLNILPEIKYWKFKFSTKLNANNHHMKFKYICMYVYVSVRNAVKYKMQQCRMPRVRFCNNLKISYLQL